MNLVIEASSAPGSTAIEPDTANVRGHSYGLSASYAESATHTLRQILDRDELKMRIAWIVLRAGSIEPESIANEIGISLRGTMDIVYEMLRAGQLCRT